MVDEDDFKAAPAPVAPKATVSTGKKLVALLEYPSQQDHWWQSGLRADMHSHSNSNINNVENFGIVDDRDDMERLTTYLDSHPVQVLLGIHSKALPDRGTLRKLDRIAEHAADGLIVQLLSDANTANTNEQEQDLEIQSAENQDVRYQQWQTALAARKIGLV